jgi:hypothetical protein
MDPYNQFADALIFGVLFASGMSLLVHLGRVKTTGLRKQVDLAMGNWDYALLVFASIGAGIMHGYFYRLSREELIVIFLVAIAPLGITRLLVKRHLRRTNAGSSHS